MRAHAVKKPYFNKINEGSNTWRKKMKLKHTMSAIAASSLLAFSVSGHAALTYSQDWEGVSDTDGAALSGDGWIIGNVNVGVGAWFAGAGAPNNTADGNSGYSAIVTGQGGPEQGNNVLSTYSDYNPWGPLALPGTQTVETFVYRDIGVIDASDANTTFTFEFDTKQGNINSVTPGAQAWAYITVLNLSDFSTTYNDTFETTTIGTDWSTQSLSVAIDASWAGQLMQIGFKTTVVESTENVFPDSGVFYDNINASNVSAVPVPAAAWLFGSALVGLGVVRRKK